MLQVTGIALNLVGLAITLYGIIREARERHAPMLKPREAAVVARARRMLKRPKTVSASLVAAVGTVETAGDIVVQKKRNPDAPIEEQLVVLEQNVDAKLNGLGRRITRAEEHASRQVKKLRDGHYQLAARVSRAEQEDRAVAGISLRIEVFGVVLALLGTTLSAID